jgi:N-acetylglutamate synthase-like GNAT family acetyltransferase
MCHKQHGNKRCYFNPCKSYSTHDMQDDLPILLLAEKESRHLKAAAALLAAQWPRGGSVADYLNLITPSEKEATTDNALLPASFLLVNSDHTKLLGHARYAACLEGSSGRAAAATYVVITASERGRGYGSQLMQQLQAKVQCINYHYLYVWTSTAIPFYEQLGYIRTERVSLMRACLKPCKAHDIARIEAALHQRLKITTAAAHAQQQHETVLLPPGSSLSSEKDVWLRKRLVECVASIAINEHERRVELERAVATINDDGANNTTITYYKFVNVPWQQQVGPSCGLAALRMLRDYYLPSCDAMPSLLKEAQQRNYSRDGEVFDICNLQRLANECCGLHTGLEPLDNVSPNRLLQLLQRKCTVILPYDSQACTYLPCFNHGRTAHYGIVVGITWTSQAAQTTLPTGEFTSRFIAYEGSEDDNDDLDDLNQSTNVQLVVQHGLCSKLCIASWQDFYQSNQQLDKVANDKYSITATTLNLKSRVLVCHGAAL